ncbi:protein PslE [Pseudomonas aeruginosa]|nr:protein PslE [Pseudomonas aeruginosa]
MIEIRSLRDLLRLLFIYQREFKLAALSALVIIVLGAFLLPAKYESNARLLVKPGRDSTLPIEISNRQALVMPSTQRDPIVDEERLLTGRPIVRQVAERYLEVLANRPPPEGLWKRTKFYVKKAVGAVFDGIRVTLETFGVIEETTAVERLAKDLEKKFEVTHAAGSTVMEISFTWSEPEVAQEVVKAWIEIYMEERTQALGRKSLYAFYEAQTADSAAQIKSYKAQILKHLNEIGASSIEDRLQDLSERINVLRGERFNSIRLIASSDSALESTRQQLKGLPREIVTVRQIALNPAQQDLRRLLNQKRLERADMMRTYTDDAPPVKALDASIRALEKEVRDEGATVQSSEDRAPNTLTTHLERVLLDETSNNAALRTQLAEQEKQLAELEAQRREALDIEPTLARLQRELNATERNYALYVDSLEKSRIDRELDKSQISNISVIEEATYNPGRIFPKTLLMLFLAVPFGLAVGLLVVYLCYLLDQRIHDGGLVEEKFGLPLWTTLPGAERQHRGEQQRLHRQYLPAVRAAALRAHRGKGPYPRPDLGAPRRRRDLHHRAAAPPAGRERRARAGRRRAGPAGRSGVARRAGPAGQPRGLHRPAPRRPDRPGGGGAEEHRAGGRACADHPHHGVRQGRRDHHQPAPLRGAEQGPADHRPLPERVLMRIALLAPLPPEKNGIADYASHFRNALQGLGIEVATPLAGVAADSANIVSRLDSVDWNAFDLVHAELGGGRLGEFIALRELRKRFPRLPLSATVHDPERMVWRRERLPWPLNLLEHLPSPLPQAAVVLADPLTLREERAVAQGLTRLVTLTGLGGECLARRMRLPPGRVEVINHGNLEIAPVPLPSLETLRLLYFGFIYRGKGIEDLLEALADLFDSAPETRQRVRLTLAGGTAAEMAFGAGGNYLDQLKGQIAELGLAEAIDWNLNLAAADIPRTIQAHHVMVLPYRESKKLGLLGQQRGTSGALSWAAACGRGAITSDARAFAEEVASGNGAIYPQGDVAALSEQLLNLAREPRLAQAWAERAGAIGHARTWARTALRFQALFNDMVGTVHGT